MEDQGVEVLGHGRARVGGEDLGGLKHGRRRPVFGLGEALPVSLVPRPLLSRSGDVIHPQLWE